MLDAHKCAPVPGRKGRKPSAFPIRALAQELRQAHPRQDPEVSKQRAEARATSMSRKKQRVAEGAERERRA